MDSTILKSLVTNPKVVDAIFGSQVFSLSKIVLNDIEFKYQSSTINFLIKDFPKAPPSSWITNQYNRVSLKVEMNDMTHCSINGFMPDHEKVDFSLSGKDNCIELKISNKKGSTIDIESKSISIREVHGYTDLSPSLF